MLDWNIDSLKRRQTSSALNILVCSCVNRIKNSTIIEQQTNTGRFIMFSVITNIYNKKIKGPTLMEFFTATGKLKRFFLWQLEMFDVCTTGDMAHINTIFKFLPHKRQHVDTCVARTWILYQCVPCHPWCTHQTSLVPPPTHTHTHKKFSCGCERFHWGRSFGFSCYKCL